MSINKKYNEFEVLLEAYSDVSEQFQKTAEYRQLDGTTLEPVD